MQNYAEQYCRAPGVGKGHCEALLRYGVSKGLSLSECIYGTDIPDNFLDDPYDISALEELVVISNILKKLGYGFKSGFEVGRRYQVTDLGLFGMAIMTSKNGAHAAKITQRYLENAFNFTNMKLTLLDDKYKITWQLRVEFEPEINRFLVGRDIGICHAVQSYVLNRSGRNAYEIGFSFPYEKGMEEVAKAFGCPVRHNQGENYIIADSKQLRARPPYSNHINSQAIEHAYQLALHKSDGQNGLSERVKNFLLETSNFNIPKRLVAQHFNVSERTLTRHLEKEESSWRSLVSEVRLEKAELLLKISSKPLQKIAEEVGFASVSSFSHAFTKYKGLSPSEYRRQLMEELVH